MTSRITSCVPGMNRSKSHMAAFRHRVLKHHDDGVFMLEALFGRAITLSTGRILPTRFIGEQHVQEDLGRIPTVSDWLKKIRPDTLGWRTNVLARRLYARCGPCERFALRAGGVCHRCEKDINTGYSRPRGSKDHRSAD